VTNHALLYFDLKMIWLLKFFNYHLDKNIKRKLEEKNDCTLKYLVLAIENIFFV